MPEGYLHLTCEQRCQIYALLQSGHSQAHIARQIGVDPSTISRELVRNTGARGYRFKQAHEKASQRRQEASDKPRKMTPDLVELIEEKLTQEQWSPDQISGRLAKDGVAFISHERIYQHVWKDKKDGGTLYLHLRHSGKKYNRRKGKNSGRGLIPNRVDIDQRPPIVAAKSRIGDWEADTIIGANHKGVVMSHVERTSKYTKLAKLPDKNADSVVQACARVLLPLADQIETITYDNGKEFASHAQIATSLAALSYFAKPYHSWERGLNEHTNGLFRQYFPKGSDFSILSDADVQRVEDKLNSRPRKILGYQTPREIFFSARNLPVALHWAARLVGRTAAETISVMLAVFARIEPTLRRSITFDNDTAFAQHARVKTMCAMTTWFCDAYASWQKGGVENANGRLRRWLPRQIDIDKVSDEEIQDIMLTANLTPRKCLGFKTPFQAILKELGKDVQIQFS